jgi:ectoine hydroxylase-related dioxygenase (phytanoyl-CoA dioxygenase family)
VIEAVTAIWMLDEFTPDGGATRVVPRSHRERAAVPKVLAQPGRQHPDEQIVTGMAGDVLVFDAHLWHSGTRNRSGALGRSVQMTCTPALTDERGTARR